LGTHGCSGFGGDSRRRVRHRFDESATSPARSAIVSRGRTVISARHSRGRSGVLPMLSTSRVLLIALVAIVGCAHRATTVAPSGGSVAATRVYPELARTIAGLVPAIEAIPAERRATLDRIVEFVQAQKSKGAEARLTFICTGNSRRSPLGQLWAAA